MPRLTQDRMIRLIRAADEAILRNKRIADLMREIRQTTIPEIFQAAQANGLTEDHPMAQQFRDFAGLFDHIIEQVTASLSIDAISTIVEERTHFNDSRIRLNNLSREAMQIKRNKNRSLDYDFRLQSDSESEEPEIEEKPVENPNAEIDLDDLHNRLWLAARDRFQGLFQYREVGALIARMGQRDVHKQLQIIEELISSGRAKTTEIEGELIPVDPLNPDLDERPETGGLLPDHQIGLAKQT